MTPGSSTVSGLVDEVIWGFLNSDTGCDQASPVGIVLIVL
jgi:hypothetical protein